MSKVKRYTAAALTLTLIFQGSIASKAKDLSSDNSFLQGSAKSSENKKIHRYVPGEVIIKYKTSVNILGAEADVNKRYSLKHKKNLNSVGAEVVALPAGSDIDSMVSKLKLDKNIEFAQPNYLYSIKDISGEERGGELWGLENKGQVINGYAGVTGVDLNINKAWSITQGDESVVVGIIDTGIDVNHPDLKGRIWTNTKEIPDNGIDDDNNGYVDDVNGWDFYNNDNTVYDEKDEDKHGTHVAGTVAAELNQIGVAGIAPKVKIMPLKFIGPFGGTTSDAIKAIEYAKNMGVKILNNSWGGSGYDGLLKEAIENSGTLFVAAAGNEMSDNDYEPTYPASFDSENILSVAAIDNRGSMPYFSNYGVNTVDVAAPGVNILSTVPKLNDIGAAVKCDTGQYKTFIQGISIEDLIDPSQRQELLHRSLGFFKTQIDDPVLIVADDESSLYDTANPASIYNDILINLGYNNVDYYHVNQGSSGPDDITLGKYKLVIWVTGDAYASTLTETDQQNLMNYLNTGGNLYLSGNSLSEELYGTDFAKNYLHVNYLYNDDNRTKLSGVSSSEYDGQTYDIKDTYSDMLEPADDLGQVVLNYKGEEDYSRAYEYLHGTSMAAPHAAGTAALLMSKGIDDPKLLKDKLLLGVQKISTLNGKVASGGMVNAFNSLRYIKDFNNDNSIDILDLAALAGSYNMKSNASGWKKIYDLNGDGIIDIFDLVVISRDLSAK